MREKSRTRFRRWVVVTAVVLALGVAGASVLSIGTVRSELQRSLRSVAFRVGIARGWRSEMMRDAVWLGSAEEQDSVLIVADFGDPRTRDVLRKAIRDSTVIGLVLAFSESIRYSELAARVALCEGRRLASDRLFWDGYWQSPLELPVMPKALGFADWEALRRCAQDEANARLLLTHKYYLAGIGNPPAGTIIYRNR